MTNQLPIRIGLFMLSAAVPMIAPSSRLAAAQSVVRTISGMACHEAANGSTHDWICPASVGSLNPTSSITGAYFDWWQSAGQGTVELSLNRFSYTGTVTMDSRTLTTDATTNQYDAYLAANLIKNNSSSYDYLWLDLYTLNQYAVPNLTGMAVLGSQ
jgi:hypothetical protein